MTAPRGALCPLNLWEPGGRCGVQNDDYGSRWIGSGDTPTDLLSAPRR